MDFIDISLADDFSRLNGHHHHAFQGVKRPIGQIEGFKTGNLLTLPSAFTIPQRLTTVVTVKKKDSCDIARH